MELDNLDTTNRYKLIQLLGGKCRICLEDKISQLEVDHIYNDGAEERSKHGSSEKIYGWYLQHADKGFKRLQPLCKECHRTKTNLISYGNESQHLPLPPSVSKMQIFMDVLKGLEGGNNIPVAESAFFDALRKTGSFDIGDIERYVRKMLRETAIYESKPGYYNRV